MRTNAVDLRRRLYIQFKGEEGLDYGGISRFVEKNNSLTSIDIDGTNNCYKM